MKEAIYDVIKKHLVNSENINDDSILIAIGIDSVDFITIIVALEEEFNIRFEDMQLIYDDYQTIGQLVSMVQGAIEKNINGQT